MRRRLGKAWARTPPSQPAGGRGSSSSGSSRSSDRRRRRRKARRERPCPTRLWVARLRPLQPRRSVSLSSKDQMCTVTIIIKNKSRINQSTESPCHQAIAHHPPRRGGEAAAACCSVPAAADTEEVEPPAPEPPSCRFALSALGASYTMQARPPNTSRAPRKFHPGPS
jgi:hypothetical protein